jgi:hypothetical protein
MLAGAGCGGVHVRGPILACRGGARPPGGPPRLGASTSCLPAVQLPAATVGMPRPGGRRGRRAGVRVRGWRGVARARSQRAARGAQPGGLRWRAGNGSKGVAGSRRCMREGQKAKGRGGAGPPRGDARRGAAPTTCGAMKCGGAAARAGRAGALLFNGRAEGAKARQGQGGSGVGGIREYTSSTCHGEGGAAGAAAEEEGGAAAPGRVCGAPSAGE